MARPATNHEERKAQIVEAALKTFARYGYEGTTNKLIAQEAGKIIGDGEKAISPALIYHYFPEGKQQLFLECLKTRPQIQNLAHFMLDNMTALPEEFFVQVTTVYYQMLSDDTIFSVFRLMLMEAPRQPEVTAQIAKQLVPIFLIPLVSYLFKMQASGIIREAKPDQLVMEFFGPLIMRRLILSVVDPKNLPIPVSDDEEFITGHVNNYLKGILVNP
jgi:AcrR family transcriptional regulator